MTEAALFYEAAISGLGDDFLDDIQHAIDSVRDRPELGTLIDYGFRRALIRRFPFSIVYAIERGKIVVVAVAHHRHWTPAYAGATVKCVVTIGFDVRHAGKESTK